MNLQGTILSEITQTEKNKYHMKSLTGEIRNTKEKHTHRERDQTDSCQIRVGFEDG